MSWNCRIVVLLAFLLASGSTPATAILVNSVADGVPGSLGEACTLRSAIAAAHDVVDIDGCQAPSSATPIIHFDAVVHGQTIVLTEGELLISIDLIIEGPDTNDPGQLTIDADEQSRLFRIVGGDSASETTSVGLSGMTLTGGTASEGGAIQAGESYADLQLEGMHLMGNSATSWGGGISFFFATLTLDNVTLEANSAGSDGGGIFLHTGTMNMANSLVSGNIASGSAGGGIRAQFSTIDIVNSTISANEAPSNGGGMSLGIGSWNVLHSTMAFNQADTGNAIHVSTSPHNLALVNSLIVQASAGEAACASQHPNSGSLATDPSCFGPAATATPSAIALQLLADNGGPTKTHKLGPGSVAIDAVAECTAAVTSDQRGSPRPAPGSNDDACDLGSFEFQHPGFELVPAIVDFGTAILGDLADERSVQLTAFGDVAATVNDITGVVPPFSVASTDDCLTGFNFILQPGESCTLWIGFDPDQVGQWSEIATFEGNIVLGQSFELSGRAVASETIFMDRFEP